MPLKSRNTPKSSISAGEWHKCRRYWKQRRECPFHPLNVEKFQPDTLGSDNEPLKIPRLPHVRPPELVPKNPGKPDRDPVDDPIYDPIPDFPTPALPDGFDPPDVERPRDIPRDLPEDQEIDQPPDEASEDDTMRLPDGAPVLARVRRSDPERISEDDQHRQRRIRTRQGGEPLTPAYAIAYANYTIRLFNREFMPKGDLFLPQLPKELNRKTPIGVSSSKRDLASTYQDALTQGETAYTRSLPSLEEDFERKSTNGESASPKSRRSTPWGKRSAALAAAAAASGVGVRAYNILRQGGGRGGFTSPGAVERFAVAP